MQSMKPNNGNGKQQLTASPEQKTAAQNRSILIVRTIKLWLWDSNKKNRTWVKRNRSKALVELTFYWIQWREKTSKQKPRSNNPVT